MPKPALQSRKLKPGVKPTLLEVGLGTVEQKQADCYDGNNGNTLE